MSSTRTGSASGRALPILAVIAGLAVLGFGLWRRAGEAPVDHGQIDGPATAARAPATCGQPPPAPADLQTLEPELRQAIEAAVQHAAANPTDANAIGRLGMIYDAHSLSDVAAPCYACARTLAPTEPKWIHLHAVIAKGSAMQDAEAGFREVIRLAPDHAPAYEFLGLMLLDRGDWGEAATLLEKVTQLRPQEASGFFALALLAVAQEKYEEAMLRLDQAERLAPRWKAVDFLRGRVLQKLGREDDALSAFGVGADSRTMFVIDPWRVEVEQFAFSRRARLDRGRQFQQRGLMDEALAVLEPLVRENPTDADAVNTLASAYLTVRRFPEARQILEALLRTQPDNVGAHLNLVQIDIARRDLDGALRHSQRAVELAPQMGRAHFQLGVVLAMMRRPAEAAEAHREAVRLEPALAEAHAGLGMNLMRMERWDDALDPLRRAVALDPSSWSFVFNLGLVYEQLDSGEESLRCLRRAKKLNPTHAPIDEALARIAHGN